MAVPMGSIRVKYEVREHEEKVEVLVDGEVVCELPASEVTWKLSAGELGVVNVQFIAKRVEAENLP